MKNFTKITAQERNAPSHYCFVHLHCVGTNFANTCASIAPALGSFKSTIKSRRFAGTQQYCSCVVPLLLWVNKLLAGRITQEFEQFIILYICGWIITSRRSTLKFVRFTSVLTALHSWLKLPNRWPLVNCWLRARVTRWPPCDCWLKSRVILFGVFPATELSAFLIRKRHAIRFRRCSITYKIT